jgi:flagellar P-ring protein precursor FlgI
MKKILYLFFLILIFYDASYPATRIKDIAYIQGVKGTEVIGYGLVIGLNNTGDTRRTIFTNQTVTSMLKRFGITVPQNSIQIRNVAAVMVTARVDAFMKSGATFDIVVSSLGDATSLQGGTLLMTPLSGIDGVVYAMAQGPVSVGGYDIKLLTGTEVRRNHTTAGRVPNGGILEEAIPLSIVDGNKVSIIVRNPDFTTSFKIADAINNKFPSAPKIAIAQDAASILVSIPKEYQGNNIIQFISLVENVEVEPDVIAKVVINEKTGTIVVGEKVQLMPAAISHGNLTIEIQETPLVSQPSPLTRGQTIVLSRDSIKATVGEGQMVAIPAASTVQDIATALNALKVNPRDIIAIFQALKEAGALKAELVIL